MKKIVQLLVVIVALLLVFFGYRQVAHMQARREVAHGFFADNYTPLASVFKREYSLSELVHYFGEIPRNESYGDVRYDSSWSRISLMRLSRDLPIECLRFVRVEDNIGFYVIYKVKEGGYYYVFWDEEAEPFSSERDPKPPTEFFVYFTAHVTSLRKESDFDSLEIGVSTAKDVARIDPAMEMVTYMSSHTPSYSLLEDGRVMKICYDRNSPFESRGDVVIESIEVVEKNDAVSALAIINPKDLP
jgi:hypothetical protein